MTTVQRQAAEKVSTVDADQLTGKGIGNVVVGDGFFMVALMLSAVESSVSSMLWLFLLFPAFYFFGKGMADVIHARQIRRRNAKLQMDDGTAPGQLSPLRESALESFVKVISGELTPVPSVTERTTRKLK